MVRAQTIEVRSVSIAGDNLEQRRGGCGSLINCAVRIPQWHCTSKCLKYTNCHALLVDTCAEQLATMCKRLCA